MGSPFQLKVSGLKRVIRGLKDFDDRINTEADAALKDIMDIVRDEYRRQFDTSGGRFGSAWAPLAPATLRNRARFGFGSGKPLIRSSLFRDSVTVKGARGSKEFVRKGVAVRTTTLKFSEYPAGVGRGGSANVLETHSRRDSRNNRPARPVRHPETGIGAEGIARVSKRMVELRDSVEKDFNREVN